MAFSPPVLGCFVNKGLQKDGGHGRPRIPLATPLISLPKMYVEAYKRSTFFQILVTAVCVLVLISLPIPITLFGVLLLSFMRALNYQKMS